jgi:hypothetical protein
MSLYFIQLPLTSIPLPSGERRKVRGRNVKDLNAFVLEF